MKRITIHGLPSICSECVLRDICETECQLLIDWVIKKDCLTTQKELIQRFMKIYEKDPLDENSTEPTIYQSTIYGICLEYLGELKTDIEKEYISTRSGIYFSFINKESKKYIYITFRTILENLPKE